MKAVTVITFVCNNIISTFFFCLPVFSQTTTIDISGGYSFPIAPSSEAVVRHTSTNTSFPYYYTTYAQIKRTSFGQGGSLALNLNWFSKKNIGFGAKLNLLFGSGFSHNTNLTTTSQDKLFYRYSDKSFSFLFIPHLCYRHDFKVISPVFELGLIIGMTHINHESTITHSRYSQTIRTNVQDHGGALLGFYSSLGMSFNLSKVVKLNLALNCIVGSYSPTKWKRTYYNVDGINQYATLTVSETSGEYVSSLNLQASQNTKQPSKDLKYSAAMSNIGLTVGLCFKFSRQKRKENEENESRPLPPY